MSKEFDDFMNNVEKLGNDVEKVTESDYVKFLEQKISTLYTEEEVIISMKYARTFNNAIRDIDFIKSLKQ